MKYSFLSLSILCLSFLTVPALAADKNEGKAPVPVIKAEKDGSITKSASRDFATRQFQVFDKDKDGAFTMKEYRVPFDAVAKARKDKHSAMDEKAIGDSFKRMDKNSDAKISKTEYLADADMRFETMDADKNGKVSPGEVTALQKKMIDAHKKATK